MNFDFVNLGEGKPSVAIVGCVHGDEVVGKKVIDNLKKIKFKKGSLTFIIANKKALKDKKRFIKQDLNRSFPGKKNGNHEENLAYELFNFLKNFDYVIDIHATNSDIRELAISTKLNKETKQLLKSTPIKKVAVVSKKLYNNNTLISAPKSAIALEYGPDKSGQNYLKVLRDVKNILKNLGFIEGKKRLFPVKDIYKITEAYKVPENFRPFSRLQEFKQIKKGDLIGYVNKKEIRSQKSFYPLFLGNGSYEGTLSLVAQKSSKKL